jgi:hypothetical protein
MSGFRFLAGAALILALLGTARAADRVAFMEQHGHWSVLSHGITACSVENRPPEEFNAAPYNSLSVRQRAQGAPVIQIYAWPDALKEGQSVRLTLAVNSLNPVELTAKTSATFIVEAPLPPDLRKDLREGRMLEVEIQGLATKLFFAITQLDAALGALQDCVQTLPKR